MPRRVRGDEVGLEGGGFAVESAADDLFDLAGVEVDAGAEARHFFSLSFSKGLRGSSGALRKICDS